MNIESIILSAMNGKSLNKDEAISLLKIKNNSKDFYKIISFANELTRTEFNNKGIIFAQIGLNAEPCSIDCKFCSMGESHYSMDSIWKKSLEEVIQEAENLISEGIHDLFLMTTADYSIDDFLNFGKNIKSILPKNIRLVANIGDFDDSVASRLKDVGFTGAYHINRLREGVDTLASTEQRIKTLEAIKNAGLELYYCVEPIGPEHSYEEIAEEMLRAREYDVGAMAVMRRTPVEGTPLYNKGQISSSELCKIGAVARIVTRPTRSMNVHETIETSLICGVNQLYAEIGANPRDSVSNTEQNRGLNTDYIKQLFVEAEFII